MRLVQIEGSRDGKPYYAMANREGRNFVDVLQEVLEKLYQYEEKEEKECSKTST